MAQNSTIIIRKVAPNPTIIISEKWLKVPQQNQKSESKSYDYNQKSGSNSYNYNQKCGSKSYKYNQWKVAQHPTTIIRKVVKILKL